MFIPHSAFPTPRSEGRFRSNPSSLGSAGLPTPTNLECPPAKVPGLFAKQCVPAGKWCKSTAFRQFQTPERTAAPAASVRGDLAGGRDRPGV